jgi:hypothetical protein
VVVAKCAPHHEAPDFAGIGALACYLINSGPPTVERPSLPPTSNLGPACGSANIKNNFNDDITDRIAKHSIYNDTSNPYEYFDTTFITVSHSRAAPIVAGASITLLHRLYRRVQYHNFCGNTTLTTTTIANMLLPSALTCETTSTPKTRYQSALFASPPLSPPPSSHSNPAHTLLSTCRALQSMLTTPNQLPSPPTLHSDIPSSPFKLRLRARKDESTPGSTVPRKRITKRNAQPPRGLNKRRRALDDDMSRDTVDQDLDDDSEQEQEDRTDGPSTPKRMRFGPEVLPLGLERSDFHSLKLQTIEQSQEQVLESVEGESEGRGGEQGEWSTEEDRLLVELVLEKLKLTKSDWQDCARSLGRDRGSVGRRWKSLMGGGEVGLKRNHLRRGKIHQTWR